MTDIMKLADDYARSPLCARQDGVIPARAALQSAIEALQATQANQSMQLAHDAVTIECLNDKVMALQYEVDAIAGIKADRDQLQRDFTYMKQQRDALQTQLAAIGMVAPLTDSYVQPVPDKCDRIVWKSRYYHLPIEAPKALAPLTDEQIDAIMPQPSEFGMHQPPWSGSDLKILRAMSRATEAAHGIGSQQ